jgi:hypothetical protein
MRTLSLVVFLSLAACGSSDAPATTGSAAPKTSAKPAASGAAATSAAADAKPADAPAGDAPAGAPADPLDDSKTPEASCDNSKKGGGCTEHYALGLGAESAQKMCEADGTWTKGAGCPKEDRVAICRTGQDRMVYYKKAIAPGNGIPELKALCDVLPEGKFAEVKK